MSLVPGEMVALNSNSKLLPRKLTIDLGRLVRTSALVNGGMGPLPDLPKMQREIDTQNNLKKNGQLVEFNIARNQDGRPLGNQKPMNDVRRARSVVNTNQANRVIAPIIQRMIRPNNPSSEPPRSTTPPVQLPDRPPRPPAGSNRPNG